MTSLETPLVMWRADTEQLRAVRVECPDGLHPNKDADGHNIYENTHYATEAEAWAHLRTHVEIGVKCAGEAIERLERELTKAQIRAGVAACEFAKVFDGMKAT